MKQNYKIYVASLLFVGAVSMMTIGAHAAPKLAVLVVGVGTNAASDAFATGIRYEFSQKGYELITTTAVTTKLKELRDKHAEGKTVDTASYLGDNNPVVFVSYDDITGSGGFLEKLNAQTGLNYRLPTEAEWEYASFL
jgi:formylglycine-generating enzyme required for sulfatase activity